MRCTHGGGLLQEATHATPGRPLLLGAAAAQGGCLGPVRLLAVDLSATFVQVVAQRVEAVAISLPELGIVLLEGCLPERRERSG